MKWYFDKPQEDDFYIVSIRNRHDKSEFVNVSCYAEDESIFGGIGWQTEYEYQNFEVFAWTYLPKPARKIVAYDSKVYFEEEQ